MKKVAIILLSLLQCYTIAMAQWSQGIFNSTSQQLVEDAVRSGFIIVRQDYQLRDTISNQKYGRNHEANFGSVYSIAVKIEHGLAVSNTFVNPWDYDSNYSQYRCSQYEPLISKTSFRELSDTTFSELKYEPTNIRPVIDSVVFYVDSLTHKDRGFLLDNTIGEKDGWLVWVCMNDISDISKEEISLVTYKHKIDFEEGISRYEVKRPSGNGHIIGGIFVCPLVSNIGTIDFFFRGMVLSTDDVNWSLFISSSTNDTTTGQEISSNGNDVLTPIGEVEQENHNTRRRTRNRNR